MCFYLPFQSVVYVLNIKVNEAKVNRSGDARRLK